MIITNYNDEILLKLDVDTLAGINLQGANLQSAILWRADLQDADLQDANLINASISSANLQGANLINVRFCNANLQNANLINARFGDGDLLEAFLGAKLSGAQLDDELVKRLTFIPEGEFIAYKKTLEGVVKLKIPKKCQKIQRHLQEV